jgi:hypothetical protein
VIALVVALVVALAVCFAWACIATAVAVANDKIAKVNDSIVTDYAERIAELEDRFQAGSLSEFRAHRPVAMPDPGPEAEREQWASDATGLVWERLGPAPADL